jgi:hypothetical protein
MAFWKKLTAVAGEALKTVNEVAATLSLDALQDKYGEDATRAAFESLDLTYITPRLIGAPKEGACGIN